MALKIKNVHILNSMNVILFGKWVFNNLEMRSPWIISEWALNPTTHTESLRQTRKPG